MDHIPDEMFEDVAVVPILIMGRARKQVAGETNIVSALWAAAELECGAFRILLEPKAGRIEFESHGIAVVVIVPPPNRFAVEQCVGLLRLEVFPHVLPKQEMFINGRADGHVTPDVFQLGGKAVLNHEFWRFIAFVFLR